jgi:hypothetical protein
MYNANEKIGYKLVKAPSKNERNEQGRVIRQGKNLSGNAPFAPKLYAICEEPDMALANNSPNQVRLIVRHMMANPQPRRGGEIIEAMISNGELRTKIDPPVLFAYYRKLLEEIGVYHVK